MCAAIDLYLVTVEPTEVWMPTAGTAVRCPAVVRIATPGRGVSGFSGLACLPAFPATSLREADGSFSQLLLILTPGLVRRIDGCNRLESHSAAILRAPEDPKVLFIIWRSPQTGHSSCRCLAASL